MRPCPACDLWHDPGVDCFEGRMYDSPEEMAAAMSVTWWCPRCEAVIPHYDTLPRRAPDGSAVHYHDPPDGAFLSVCGPLEARREAAA